MLLTISPSFAVFVLRRPILTTGFAVIHSVLDHHPHHNRFDNRPGWWPKSPASRLPCKSVSFPPSSISASLLRVVYHGWRAYAVLLHSCSTGRLLARSLVPILLQTNRASTSSSAFFPASSKLRSPSRALSSLLCGYFIAAPNALPTCLSLPSAASETESPRRNVSKAVRRVFWRILVFYVSPPPFPLLHAPPSFADRMRLQAIGPANHWHGRALQRRGPA